jgi:hypothetical protein
VIKKFAASGELDLANSVNKAARDPQLRKLSVRYLDKVGVLLHVMRVLAEHKICVEEM